MRFVKTVDRDTRTYSRSFSIKDSEKLTKDQYDAREDEFVEDMVLEFKNDPPKGYVSCQADFSFLPYTGTVYNIIAERGIFLTRMVEYRAEKDSLFGTTYFTYTILLRNNVGSLAGSMAGAIKREIRKSPTFV